MAGTRQGRYKARAGTRHRQKGRAQGTTKGAGTRHRKKGRVQGTVKGAGTRHRPYNMGIGKGVGYDMILVGLILYLTIAIEFFQNF